MPWNNFIRFQKVIWEVLCKPLNDQFLGHENVENQTFQKKGFLPVTKDFCLIFLALSSVANIKRQLVRLQKVSWQLLWKLWDHFCNTYETVENTIFWKKSQFIQWNKLIEQFFWCCRVQKTSRNTFRGSRRYSGNYCGSEKINSLGPKKSIETNISKNRYFHDDKIFWPLFRRFNECDKPQETTYRGPPAILTTTVEFIWAFFQHLRSCWKHKVLKKKLSFKEKKYCRLYSLLKSSVSNLSGHFVRFPKVLAQLLWKL